MSSNNFSDSLKAFFSDLGAEIKRLSGMAGEWLGDTFANLKYDLSYFFRALKEGREPAETSTRRQGGGGYEPRPGRRVVERGGEGTRVRDTGGETVRSRYYDDTPSRERRKSATNSRYDEDYTRKKAPAPTWWRITRGFLLFIVRSVATLLLICVMTGCIVGVAGMVYVLTDLDKDLNFDLDRLKLAYTTVIYVKDENGDDVEYQRLHGSQNRIWVDYSQMPETLKNAFIAIEDKRFRSHSGVDWIRTGRAFIDMFLSSGGSVQGGSTITQQLIKNITEEDEVSVERKLKEIFRAMELEKKYTKDVILEAYLNVIALGNGCNGVQAAANTYFDKDVSDLTLAECACIAGITKNPSKYNPLYNPIDNKDRQEDVLYFMKQQEMISQEEYDAAIAQELVFNEKARYNADIKSYNNWYVDQIIYDLISDLQTRAGMSDTLAKYNIYNGGLSVYANMDVELQNQCEAIFKKASNFKKFPKKVQPQCAIAVMNYSGEVKAIVGGRGTKSQDLVLNRASQSRRQPGSSFKPVSVYGPAVEYGLLEYSTPVTDSPSLVVNGKKWPKNSGGAYRGNVPVVKGVEVSANCVAVRVSTILGYERAYTFMTERLGFTLVYNRKVGKRVQSDTNPSTCLGALTDGVTVLEMTAAYATFGNGGKFYKPAFYSRVIDAEGNILIDNTNVVPTQAFSKETATIMNRMLRMPVLGSNGTAKKAKFGKYAMFGKTGTTTDNKDRYYAGGTPYYVSACWFGYDKPKGLEITNPNHAMMAWRLVMVAAHKGLSADKNFVMSDKVVSRKYCTVTGGIAGAGCGSTATGYYVKGSKLPICPLHSGGASTDAFTRFLANKSQFGTGEESETSEGEESTTSKSTTATTPQVIVTPPPTTKSTESTTKSTTKSTESTTKSTTKSTESTTKSTESTTKSTESTTKQTDPPEPPEPPEQPEPQENSGLRWR